MIEIGGRGGLPPHAKYTVIGVCFGAGSTITSAYTSNLRPVSKCLTFHREERFDAIYGQGGPKNGPLILNIDCSVGNRVKDLK